MLSANAVAYLKQGMASTQYGQEVADAINASTTSEYVTIVTSAEILDLANTPVVLLPQPDTGQTIRVINWDMTYVFGTTPYTITAPTTDIVGLIYGNGNPSGLMLQQELLSASQSKAFSVIPGGGQIFPGGNNAAVSFESEQPIVLAATNSPTGGDGYLYVRLVYQIVPSLVAGV